MTDEQQKGLEDTPVQDISDSKADAEESFLKELDDAEKSEPVASTTAGADAGKDKSKSKFSAAVEAASKPKRKHSMDPILAVSLVVLLLASCVVLGNAAYSEYIEKGQTTTVSYGDTVVVDYVGTFKAFYEGDKETTPVVFDTNIEDVGKFLDNHPDAHSWGYTTKSSYTGLSFVVGGDTVLKKFGSATINHKVGDVIKVQIEKDDGYELPETSKGKLEKCETLEKELVMTSSEFTAMYGFSAPTNGPAYYPFDGETKKLCPFGCSYTVYTIEGNVHVVNEFKLNEETKAYGLDKATIKITKNDADDKYTIDYSKVEITESGKMTKVPVLHDNAWIVGYIYEDDDTAKTKMFKTGETLGTNLYFYIKVTSITKAS